MLRHFTEPRLAGCHTDSLLSPFYKRTFGAIGQILHRMDALPVLENIYEAKVLQPMTAFGEIMWCSTCIAVGTRGASITV